MQARHEVVAALAERYRSASGPEKSRLLDEIVNLTGWHRKHAIRALKVAVCCDAGVNQATRKPRRRLYGAIIEDALSALWEASDRLCGKRLKAMIPTLLPALERHGRLVLSASDRSSVLMVSAETIDRLLAARKQAANGGKRRRAGFSSAVRRSVPVRTFNDWGDVVPGFCEVDMVAHGGTNVEGVFIQTLTMVDVVTGWTQCLPLVTRDGNLVVEALGRARAQFPWPLRGLDFDNDSAFMNDVVVPWCRRHSLEVTRSRAYKKNDQAFVEQKNGAVVRRLVGYGRFEGIESARILSRLYAAACLLANFFQPSFKLKSKRREGAKVIKRYYDPETPCARALAHPEVDAATKARLQTVHATLDPLALLAEIRTAQEGLGHRVDRRAGNIAKASTTSVAIAPATAFASAIGKELLAEHRAIHRRPYVRRKPVPRRPSMLDDHAASIDGWLTAEPYLTAAEILHRLRELNPIMFTCQQQRTIQRAIKSWRGKASRALLDNAADTLVPVQSRVQHAAMPQSSVGNMAT